MCGNWCAGKSSARLRLAISTDCRWGGSPFVPTAPLCAWKRSRSVCHYNCVSDGRRSRNSPRRCTVSDDAQTPPGAVAAGRVSAIPSQVSVTWNGGACRANSTARDEPGCAPSRGDRDHELARKGHVARIATKKGMRPNSHPAFFSQVCGVRRLRPVRRLDGARFPRATTPPRCGHHWKRIA